MRFDGSQTQRQFANFAWQVWLRKGSSTAMCWLHSLHTPPIVRTFLAFDQSFQNRGPKDKPAVPQEPIACASPGVSWFISCRLGTLGSQNGTYNFATRASVCSTQSAMHVPPMSGRLTPEFVDVNLKERECRMHSTWFAQSVILLPKTNSSSCNGL